MRSSRSNAIRMNRSQRDWSATLPVSSSRARLASKTHRHRHLPRLHQPQPQSVGNHEPRLHQRCHCVRGKLLHSFRRLAAPPKQVLPHFASALCSIKFTCLGLFFGGFFVHASIPGLHGSIRLCVGQPWPWPTLVGQTWPKQAWPPLVDNAHLLDSATSTQQGRLRTTRPPLLNEVGSFQ